MRSDSDGWQMESVVCIIEKKLVLFQVYFIISILIYSHLFDSVPKAGVCTGGAPNAPVRLQDCCKSSSDIIIIIPHPIFLFQRLMKQLFSNLIL